MRPLLRFVDGQQECSVKVSEEVPADRDTMRGLDEPRAMCFFECSYFGAETFVARAKSSGNKSCLGPQGEVPAQYLLVCFLREKEKGSRRNRNTIYAVCP